MTISLPRGLKVAVRRTLHRALRGVVQPIAPLVSNPDRVFGIERASIDPTARLYVLSETESALGHIRFGNGAYVGRHAEVTAARGDVEIDNDSSIQDFCVIYGDVRIGAHCMFAMHAFVTSTSHRFRDRPEWLIRDQDTYFGAHPDEAIDPPSRRVEIEDDCWIGWCAVVLPGVYVGRGAVLGANCVVTSDVAPYEIHGGSPNRKLATRLDFSPPTRIAAEDDSAIPYFYRGFLLSQEALRRSREIGVVEARRKACFILRRADGAGVTLNGKRTITNGDLRLRICINGYVQGEHDLQPGPFQITIAGQQYQRVGKSTVPSPLMGYTYVELEITSPSGDLPGYGIGVASLC